MTCDILVSIKDFKKCPDDCQGRRFSVFHQRVRVDLQISVTATTSNSKWQVHLRLIFLASLLPLIIFLTRSTRPFDRKFCLCPTTLILVQSFLYILTNNICFLFFLYLSLLFSLSPSFRITYPFLLFHSILFPSSFLFFCLFINIITLTAKSRCLFQHG